MTKRDPASVDMLRSALLPIIATLKTKIQAIYLHGSWGTDWVREDSDIDLAILAGTKLGFEERMAIFREVYKMSGGEKEIDVADLIYADCIFSAQVITKGERILEPDRNAAERFEMIALAKYARLNEERAEIIADIHQRGTIYLTGAAA